MNDFSSAAREAMHARDLSIRAAARALNFDHAFLSRVLSGKQRPSQQLAAALDELMDQGGRLLALVAAEPSPVPTLSALAPDPDMHARMSAVIGGPNRVDDSVADWLERCLAEHRKAEDALGGGPLEPIIRAQLATVNDFGRQAPSELRDRLVSLASQYGQFLAWIMNDLGNKPAAVAFLSQAHDWAQDAADPNMAATTLSMKAHIAWSQNDGLRTVRMGEAAQWYDARLTSGVEGMASQMVARGHAVLGNADAAHRSLDEAQRLITKASEKPEDERDWMYFYDSIWFLAQRGMIELELGDGARAVPLLGQALDAMSVDYKRDRVWYAACLAKAHALAGDLDAAAGVASDAAPDALAVNAYAAEELRGIAVMVGKSMPRLGRDLSAALRH